MRSTPSETPSQKGCVTASGTGKARSVTAKDQCRGRGEDPARAVGQRDPRALDLARPALAAELAGGLDQGEDAVHAGVAVGEAAAVRVHRKVASWCRPLAAYERARLAAAAEAEGLQGEQDRDGEAVVQLDNVDIGGRQPGHRERRGAAVDG